MRTQKALGDDLSRARLGRGLAALIGDVDDKAGDGKGGRSVPIEFLRRNPRNPRTRFSDEDLNELATSIRQRGIIQPILVRPLRDLPDAYEIIAGERRWRAAQRAGLHEVPVNVVDADDQLALELAIIENVQRTDLNALEEATGYDHLISQHGYSQSDLAEMLGKSRSHVANMLRLLKLPEEVREMLARGDLSAGHARALLAFDDPRSVAGRVIERGLTVREVERLAQKAGEDSTTPRRPRRERSPALSADTDARALEAELQDLLGMAVTIRHRDNQGEIRIRYLSLDQLDSVCRSLRRAGG